MLVDSSKAVRGGCCPLAREGCCPPPIRCPRAGCAATRASARARGACPTSLRPPSAALSAFPSPQPRRTHLGVRRGARSMACAAATSRQSAFFDLIRAAALSAATVAFASASAMLSSTRRTHSRFWALKSADFVVSSRFARREAKWGFWGATIHTSRIKLCFRKRSRGPPLRRTKKKERKQTTQGRDGRTARRRVLGRVGHTTF